MRSDFKFETLQLHSGQEVDESSHSRALPIYQTTSFTFDDTAHAANLFGLDELGNIYTRLMNPTTNVLETRVTELEGGVAGVAVASGMAAITYAIQAVAQKGDHIVASSTLYGGTHTLFTHTLPKYGIDVTLVDTTEVSHIENALQDNTKALFVETIGNPEGNVEDFDALVTITKAQGIPLIVDNTSRRLIFHVRLNMARTLLFTLQPNLLVDTEHQWAGSLLMQVILIGIMASFQD